MKNHTKSARYINLACGSNYVIHNEWINLDFIEREGVKKTNLMEKLKFSDSSIDGIYCSHFIEHVPENRIIFFLEECRRILKVGGILRIVVPDFERMTREYLKHRDSGDDQKANFMMISIIDQFVRKKPGGKLAEFINETINNDDDELKKYITKRCGNIFNQETIKSNKANRAVYSKIISYFRNKYINFVTYLLPRSFRYQNLSMAEVGELHNWIYDKKNLSTTLNNAGFTKIKEMKYDLSEIVNFPLSLDVDEFGQPKKGYDSLFIEATR